MTGLKMFASIQNLDQDILNKAKQILEYHFKVNIEISSVYFLSGEERRNLIARIFIGSKTSSIPKSIILKQSLREQFDEDDCKAFSRFARDWAGLEFANQIHQSIHNVPRFYGGSKQHRFILIEDLGDHHVSLVDSLTLPYREKAIQALTRFMKSLGSFHAASYGKTEKYEALLKKIHEPSEKLKEDFEILRSELIEKLQLVCHLLSIPLTKECIQEVNELFDSLIKPGEFTVLTHGDICPDNVFDHESRDLQLIDFEWASIGNALLDGTYLRMCMPTCWCAKAIPEEIIIRLETIYREELKRSIPAAVDDLAYSKAYTEACGFWILQQTLPFLESTLEKDRVGPSGLVPENSLWDVGENWVRPRVLSRLQAFIHIGYSNDLLPHLRLMAENILLQIKKIWRDVNHLEFYAAFLTSCKQFYIRSFQFGDETEIYQLFYDTVHFINEKDYTKEQLNAWAPTNPNLAEWRQSLSRNYSFVAIDQKSGKIIGFCDMDKNGYLNRGYVHKDFQRKGVGIALLEVREQIAAALGIHQLFSDVSITAKSFYEHSGYVVEEKQIKELNGLSFINYRMIKTLSHSK